jgi:hypothetical protein
MKQLRIALLTAAAFIVVLLLQHADAVSRLTLNADDKITQLYGDGVDISDLLTTKGDVKKCDTIDLPPNVGVIAIEAQNYKAARGIQSCRTSDTALYEDWVCRPSKKAQGDRWYEPDYDTRNWKPAKTYKCETHCHKYYKQPCDISSTKCFWSHKPATTCRCILKQCADGCLGCKQAGPGNCDPGKCKLGSGLDVLKNKEVCQRKCRLEIKSWGKSGEAADGYVKLTDLDTNSEVYWNGDAAGDYVATIDMSTCSITNKNYCVWSENGAKNSLKLREWSSSVSGSDFVNVIGVEVGNGPNDAGVIGPIGSYAAWISIFLFGLDLVDPILGNGRYHYFSATLTGVQNGNVTFSDVVLTP